MDNSGYRESISSNNKKIRTVSFDDVKNIHLSHGEVEHTSDGEWIDGEFIRFRGLHWFVTGLFIIGDMAGGGLVALPTAMIQTGFYFGLICIIILAAVTCYTSICLGRCWQILLRNWPEYESHCRKPYSEMAYRACGPIMKTAISVCIDVTQFGIAVVYLLLVAKNLSSLLNAFFDFHVSFCLLILIVALFLLPITFLKSPQDFWWAVVCAMITTSIAVILIVWGSIVDYDYCHKEKQMPEFVITNYFVGLGTFLFAYGGHSSLPTIQHDMKQPSQFTRASIFAFSGIFALYLPAGIMGYLTYGDSLRDSIIQSLQTTWIQQAVNICITIHCILTLTIVFNPLNQEIEELFNVPQKFGPKRIIVRTSIMVLVVFVAESVPNFGPLLDLIGGTTITTTSVLLPVTFYMMLSARQKLIEENGKDIGRSVTFKELLKYCPKVTLILCVVIFIIGLLGGAAATYSSIRELTSTHFSKPCYVSVFEKSSTTSTSSGYTNCCGHYQNISIYGDTQKYCSSPELSFYS
uniref:Aa_trans domain-containing protein n=1 Tax=Strongyloides papillosus TaxID=174720 RepID=A0A0N5BDM8_STREA